MNHDDSWKGVVWVCAFITLAFILFGGDPDIADAIRERIYPNAVASK